MTTLSSQRAAQTATTRGAVEVSRAEPVPAMARVAWTVSRLALRTAVAASRPEIRVAPGRSPARLEWRVECSSEGATRGVLIARATAWLVDDSTGDGIALGPAREGVWLWDREGEEPLLHVEIVGAMICTLARRDGAWRTLYATTPLLSELGLAGGRYDVSPTA